MDLEFWKTRDWEAIKTLIEDYPENWAPAKEDVFRALILTPPRRTKVVILGQDPYHSTGPHGFAADGLAFSTRLKYRPPSLRNIFVELQNDLGIKAESNSLEKWARQGVLLLNTALTVEVNKPGSHSNLGWSTLIDEMIYELSVLNPHIVFILWGKHAQMVAKDIGNHPIIATAHPSPYAADKGFFGSRPFSKCNQMLKKMQRVPIDWSIHDKP